VIEPAEDQKKPARSGKEQSVRCKKRKGHIDSKRVIPRSSYRKRKSRYCEGHLGGKNREKKKNETEGGV